ncbi:MAG: hypothetical protein WC325_13950, partial [Candidatus Bathyarchaeia archaeon]
MKKSAIVFVFFVLTAFILGLVVFQKIIVVNYIFNSGNLILIPKISVIPELVHITGLTPTVAKVGDMVS